MALWRNKPVVPQQNIVSAVTKPQSVKQKIKHLLFLTLCYILIGVSILFILYTINSIIASTFPS